MPSVARAPSAQLIVLIDHVRGVGPLFGHQQHAVLTHLAQADRAHHQPADEAAFGVQAVFGLLVDVGGVHHVRVEHQVVDLRGEQPGRGGRVAGVAADGAVDAGGDEHHGVEGAGPFAVAAAEVEQVRQPPLERGFVGERFHFALVAAAVFADDAEPNGLLVVRHLRSDSFGQGFQGTPVLSRLLTMISCWVTRMAGVSSLGEERRPRLGHELACRELGCGEEGGQGQPRVRRGPELLIYLAKKARSAEQQAVPSLHSTSLGLRPACGLTGGRVLRRRVRNSTPDLPPPREGSSE